MFNQLSVKIPQDLIIKSFEKISQCSCKRLQPHFNLDSNNNWYVSYTCGGYDEKGIFNGYGVGFTCSQDCKLKIKI